MSQRKHDSYALYVEIKRLREENERLRIESNRPKLSSADWFKQVIFPTKPSRTKT